MTQYESSSWKRDKIRDLDFLVRDENNYKHNKEKRKNMVIFCLSVFIITSFTSLMNLYIGSWLMAASTFFIGISSVVFFILLLKKKDVTDFAMNFYVFSLSAIFTYYFIIGGNEGFAALWIVLVPFFIVLVGSSRQLIYISAYFLIFLILFCYTPLRQYLQYPYNVEFLKRFPILYSFCFSVSASVAYRIHTFEVAQDHAVENLNQAVLEEKLRNHKLSFQTIIAMSVALDAKDESTKHHSERVAEISRAIALQLGWSDDRAEEIYQAGMVHDIGKIGIGDSILKKDARLTDEEYGVIKTHPQIGYNILKPCIESDMILNVVLHHHERYDGRGYPDGLQGEQIPLEARIASVADSFDAMNSNRVYRQKCSTDYVIGELQRGRGSQFDPYVVDAFMSIVDDMLAQYQ